MRYDYSKFDKNLVNALQQKGLTTLQASIVAARIPEEKAALAALNSSLKDIQHPKYLKNAEKAADRIAIAIINGQTIGVFSDYDVDGLTGGSVIVLSLSQYFLHPPHKIVTLIGNRLTVGYGLSDGAFTKISDAIDRQEINKPSVIITVDCGSSDQHRIKKLDDLGVDVVVTDHHAIPPDGPPKNAYTCVNPQQAGCQYKDKSIAGVAVGWLVMSLTRNKLIELGHIPAESKNLAGLLDYVALGTVADAVSIASPTNRAIVKYGLKIINANVRAPWQAMKILTSKEGYFDEKDLGFAFGPRINARSRMDDPYASSHYLLANNLPDALNFLRVLDDDNEERKKTQREMTDIAKSRLQESERDHCVVVFDETFHEGVQGIVSSKMTEITGKPSVVFSPSSDPNTVKGSGRTIKGVDLHEVFTTIEQELPGIHIRVGGHEGAFGCSILKKDIGTYREKMNDVISNIINYKLTPYIEVDVSWTNKFGSINDAHDELKAIGPFGRKFEYPIISLECSVITTRIVGKENPVHAQITLYDQNTNENYEAIHFNAIESPGESLHYKEGDIVDVYVEIGKNSFRGKETTQLLIKDVVLNKQTSINLPKI